MDDVFICIRDKLHNHCVLSTRRVAVRPTFYAEPSLRQGSQAVLSRGAKEFAVRPSGFCRNSWWGATHGLSSNMATVRLYTRAGFNQYGIEGRALKVGDHYNDELLMALGQNEVG
jgi:hypothetical protein